MRIFLKIGVALVAATGLLLSGLAMPAQAATNSKKCQAKYSHMLCVTTKVTTKPLHVLYKDSFINEGRKAKWDSCTVEKSTSVSFEVSASAKIGAEGNLGLVKASAELSTGVSAGTSVSIKAGSTSSVYTPAKSISYCERAVYVKKFSGTVTKTGPRGKQVTKFKGSVPVSKWASWKTWYRKL